MQIIWNLLKSDLLVKRLLNVSVRRMILFYGFIKMATKELITILFYMKTTMVSREHFIQIMLLEQLKEFGLQKQRVEKINPEIARILINFLLKNSRLSKIIFRFSKTMASRFLADLLEEMAAKIFVFAQIIIPNKQ